MRRILVFVLVLMLLPFALAEQAFLVVDNGVPSDWGDGIPAGYEDVLACIARSDAAAAKAGSVYFYPDGDGCWVFCRTKADVYHAGSFWYVNGDNAQHLGSGKNIWQWDFFPGEGVFYCEIGKPENRKLNAAIAVDGAPVLLDVPEEIVYLYGMAGGSALAGMVDINVYDYVFLTVDGTSFRELEAVPMDPAEFTALPGAQEILMELAEDIPSTRTATFLQRDNGIITMNVEHDDGAVQHAYLWVQDGGLRCMRGWENEIALFDGAGSAKLLGE